MQRCVVAQRFVLWNTASSWREKHRPCTNGNERNSHGSLDEATGDSSLDALSEKRRTKGLRASFYSRPNCNIYLVPGRRHRTARISVVFLTWRFANMDHCANGWLALATYIITESSLPMNPQRCPGSWSAKNIHWISASARLYMPCVFHLQPVMLPRRQTSPAMSPFTAGLNMCPPRSPARVFGVAIDGMDFRNALSKKISRCAEFPSFADGRRGMPRF